MSLYVEQIIIITIINMFIYNTILEVIELNYFCENYQNNENRFGRECAFLYICGDDNRRESRSPRDEAWLFKCCTHTHTE